MKLTLKSRNTLIAAQLSKSEIKSFELVAYAEGLAIARSEGNLFLVVLNKNLSIIKVFKATKDSVQEVFRLWIKDLADDIRHPTIKIEFLDLSNKEISDEDLKLAEGI